MRAKKPLLFERLADALVDPARRERTMAMLLIGYALVWSLYGALAKGSQDVHLDMGEMLALSREPSMGTPKHPPLGAWVVGLWFSVMPRTDWTYYLLAMLMPALALWIAWRLSAVAGLALLTLLPFMNFHALKYNANTVLIPLWAATTCWFLRSFETRRVAWAALAGVGAAAAMLGKYWSICLIAGLGIAALVDSRRSAYFRSPAPWVSSAVGTVLLAPHVLWLFTHEFGPVGYAALRHKESLSPVLVSALVFLAGFAGYIAPAVLGALLAARPTLQALRDMVFPTSPQRRLVNVAFFAPVLLAITAAIVLRVEIADVWMIPAATLLPIVLLSSALVMMRRKAVVWLLAIAIPFPVVMVVAAPGIAMVIHRMGLERHHADHYRLLAQALERSWREATDASLRLVGGDFDLVSGALFYLRDRASAYFIIYPSLSPWVDETRIEDEGIALVCPTDEPMCVSALSARSMRTGVRPTEITLVREYLGVPGPPTRYVIAVIPPNFGKR